MITCGYKDGVYRLQISYVFKSESNTWRFREDGKLLSHTRYKLVGDEIVKKYELEVDYNESYTKIKAWESKNDKTSYAKYGPNIDFPKTYEDSNGNYWDIDLCSFRLSSINQYLHSELSWYYELSLMTIFSEGSIILDEIGKYNDLVARIRTCADLLRINGAHHFKEDFCNE